MNEKNTKTVRIGLIGVGNMGQNHLRVLSMTKGVELVFVCDADGERAASLSQQYGIQAIQSLGAHLPDIDAVVIATPTATHYDFIKQVGAHVQHIFVEKPMTDTLLNSKQILQFATEKNIKIQIGFIERFNPAIIALKKVLDSADSIINIDFVRTNKLSSRITDVDVVVDLMVHDVDLAIYLNGAVKSIKAYGTVDNGMIGFARATLEHENGVFSNITASRITEKRIRHISATCAGMYIDCNLLNKEVYIHNQSSYQYYDNVSISSKQETIAVPPIEALASELRAFSDYVRGCPDVAVPTAEDDIATMQVIDVIQKQIKDA